MREGNNENLQSPEEKGIDAATLRVTPVLTAKQFEESTKGEEAVVLIAFASGTAPGWLAPVIKQRTEEGVPIFLLSDNRADKHGIVRTKYEAQNVVEEAGAIPLRKVNINNLREVLDAIKEVSVQGLRGGALGQAIYDHFDYKDGEEPPTAAWERGEKPPIGPAWGTLERDDESDSQSAGAA